MPVTNHLMKATYLGKHIIKFRYGKQILIGALYADENLYNMLRYDTTTEEDLKAPYCIRLSNGDFLPLLKCRDVALPDR